jgi:hypothetical protein
MTAPWLSPDTPWYVQTGLFVLFWLGPAAIIAAVFLAMWTGWLPSPITDNNRILVRVESKLDSATARMADEVRSSNAKDEHVVRLLLATCRNVARTEMDRVQCDNYWKR